MNSYEIIKTMRVTEKGTRQSEKYNQYTVVADRRANKGEIRQAVQELFKVKVLRVNTLNVRGKARRSRSGPRSRCRGRSCRACANRRIRAGSRRGLSST